MSDIHIIKLVVGIDDIQSFYELQQRETFDYHGTPAAPCWTRYAPKCADEILRKGGSIYRVIKGRIMCRHKILGFETIEDTPKGTMCMIVQDATMIETVHMPRRAFQGWRYLKSADAPPDKGLYKGDSKRSIPPDDLKLDLEQSGLL
ncbi:MAG: DUF1489 family protein [Alphaproteobacteria bacterium]